MDVQARDRVRIGLTFRMALLAGAEGSVLLHLSTGEDVNALDDSGRSPLILAATRGHVDVCSLLLARGADIGIRDGAGRDALTAAREQGHHSVAKLLEGWAKLPPRSHVVDRVPAILPDQVVRQAGDSQPVDQVSGPIPAVGETRTFPETGTGTVVPWTEAQLHSPLPESSAESLDLSDWEEETEGSPPRDDPTCAAASTDLQQLISRHVVIDPSEDWNDIELELPDPADVRQRNVSLSPDQREAIRLLLVEGLRDGRVRRERIQQLDVGAEEGSEDHRDFHASLELVIGDLGIIIDEDCAPDPFRDPDESDDELHGDRAFVAVGFLSRLLGSRDALFFRYLDATPKAILTHGEIRSIAEERDAGIHDAIGVVATHAAAINRIRRDAEAVLDGRLAARVLIEAEHSVSRAAGEQEQDGDDERPDKHTPDPLSSPSADSEAMRLLVDACTPAAVTTVHLAACLRSSGLRQSYLESLCQEIQGDPAALGQFTEGLERARRAKNKLAVSHLRFVVWVAKRHRGLTLMDRVQEGNLGLLRAAEKFSPSREVKFSTYAMWWIKQSIMRAVADKDRTIRVPVHALETLARINRSRAALEARGIPDPSNDAIAIEGALPIELVEKRKGIAAEPVGIPELEEEVQAIVDPSAGPADFVQQIGLQVQVTRLLATLDPREERVLRMRFGIGVDEHTLEEVGQDYGVTRERIRQIEAKALMKLGHVSRSKHLRTAY